MVELRLSVFMRKDQPVNDIGTVLFEESGDRMKFLWIKIPAPADFPVTDYERWGEAFKALRTKYATALNVDERFLSVKLISVK